MVQTHHIQPSRHASPIIQILSPPAARHDSRQSILTVTSPSQCMIVQHEANQLQSAMLFYICVQAMFLLFRSRRPFMVFWIPMNSAVKTSSSAGVSIPKYRLT